MIFFNRVIQKELLYHVKNHECNTLSQIIKLDNFNPAIKDFKSL